MLLDAPILITLLGALLLGAALYKPLTPFPGGGCLPQGCGSQVHRDVSYALEPGNGVRGGLVVMLWGDGGFLAGVRRVTLR